MSPMGPGTYGSQKGRPPKPKAPKINATGLTPEMKRKL